jgi:hypothetical protein
MRVTHSDSGWHGHELAAGPDIRGFPGFITLWREVCRALDDAVPALHMHGQEKKVNNEQDQKRMRLLRFWSGE